MWWKHDRNKMREEHNLRIFTRKQLYKEQNKICIYCGKKISYENASLDHIIPVLHLEENIGINNLVMCCKKCNKNKDSYFVFTNLFDKIIYPMISIPVIFQDRFIHNTKKIRS